MSSRSFSGRNGGAWTLQTFAMRYSTKTDRIKKRKQDTKLHIHTYTPEKRITTKMHGTENYEGLSFKCLTFNRM